MSRSRRRRAAAAAGLAAVGATACASAPAKPLPPPPAVVRVTMSEYRFDFRPPTEPGRAVFRVRNVGRVPHRLTLLPLEEDIPPILQQLRGDQRRVISPFAGIPDRRPGGTGVFAANLEPGRRYAMICFVVDPDPQTGQPSSHAIRGMATEFRAPGVRPRQDTTTTAIPEAADTTTVPEGGAATTVPEAADSTTATEPAPEAGQAGNL